MAADAGAQEPLRRIIVSVPDRQLALIEGGKVVKRYPVAVGAAATPTPEGLFSIQIRLVHPTWYGPRKVVAPGKANPLGTRWIGLTRKGYGIHGTNNVRSIGRKMSQGCVRMRNEDVEELFEMISVGDRVDIRLQRDEELSGIFGLTEMASASPKPEQGVR
jgi:lipoprotein-anchoring transpeptidase ErfK/SrfK